MEIPTPIPGRKEGKSACCLASRGQEVVPSYAALFAVVESSETTLKIKAVNNLIEKMNFALSCKKKSTPHPHTFIF